MEGPWLKADQKIKQAVETVKANQQPDGTFSTNYFIRPSTSDDMGTRLGTTGHTFEFLTVALDDRQIHEPWYEKSLLALLDMLERMEDLELECGGLYHSMHGLQLYRARVFGPPDESSDKESSDKESSDKSSAGASAAATPQTVEASQPPSDAPPALP